MPAPATSVMRRLKADTRGRTLLRCVLIGATMATAAMASMVLGGADVNAVLAATADRA